MLSFLSHKKSPQVNQDVLSLTETVKLKTTAAHFLEQLKNDNIKSDVMLKLTECNDAQFSELLDLLCEKNLNHLIKSLTIKRCGLTKIPEKIGQLHQLQTLKLHENQICKIPSSLTQCTQLDYLNLSTNKLQSLPEDIDKLQNLRDLTIHENLIQKLPESLPQCHRLKELYISQNLIEWLPIDIGRCPLEILDADDNQLQYLPRSISQCSELRELLLDTNQLSFLPEELGRLKKLEQLNISNNHIEELPNSILKCSELRVLYSTECKLKMLPQRIDRLTKLEELALGNNQLLQLPDSICKLHNLRKLYVWQNQLTSLPDEIGNCPLEILHASDNHLKTLPASLSRITTLDNGELYLEGNQLVSLPALKNPLALTSRSLKDIQANSKRANPPIQDMATAVVSLSYQDIVAGCAQPLIATRHDGTLERTYLTSTKTGATKLWPMVKSGGYDIARGGLHTSIGLGKTFVLTTSALAISSINLSATILDMFTSFLTMQFVTLSYCTTLAAKGIVIDPMLMLYNLIQYANDEDFVEPQLAPQSLSTWYQEHIQSILQFNESGFEAHQLAHESKARHFSCIAALVDLIVCEAHIFTKTAAKAVRATLRAGHTIQRLSGHGLNHTAHGALLMGQGSAKLAAILVTLASIPLKVAVTEGTILAHERCHKITFEDAHSKLTQNLEDSLMLSSVGYQTPMVSA